MATKKKGVHVTPRGDKWAVVREGNERATSLHDTQAQAEKKGRETARRNKTEFYLHNQQGQIRERHSYGKDQITERDSYGKDPYPKGPTRQRSARKYRMYTEEELMIFAEEDELDSERAKRLETFLRTR